MKYAILISSLCVAFWTVPALAKKIKVPKEINGQRVYYVGWQKKHSSGSTSGLIQRARFRLSTTVPYPYQNSKTCFFNKKRVIIVCR